MNTNQLSVIVAILMATFKLLMMEDVSQNPIEWNITGPLEQLKHGTRLTSYDRKSSTEIYDNVHEYKSVYNFRTLLQGYQLKYTNPMNNNSEINLMTIPCKLHLNMSNEHNQTTNKSNSDTKWTTKLDSWNVSVPNRSDTINSSGNVTKDRSNRQRMLKNCENDCNNIWNPRLDYKQDNNMLINNNQDQYTKPNHQYPKDPLISRLKTFMNYKSNNLNNANQWPNNILNRNILCNSSSNMNKNCSTNLANNNIPRKHFVVPNNYDKSRNFNTYRSLNMRNPIQNPFIRNDNKRSYDYQQNNYESDWPNSPRDISSRDITSNGGSSKYNDQIQAPPHDDNAVGFPNGDENNWHNDQTEHDEANTDQDFKISFPANSYSLTDDTEFNKWHDMQNDVNKNEDKRALSRLQDMYYCNKYCKCCKKGRQRVTFKYYEYGPVGKILSIMKYFGFSSGHDFFYGRTPVPRSDSHNPLNYIRDYYHRYYGHPVDMYMDDEKFVFHDPDKGEPEGVSECKEVCTCCEEDKREKLRQRLNEIKRKEAIRKRRLQGFTGLIRYLLFSDEEGYYDFVDGDLSNVPGRGRSYTGSHQDYSHNKRTIHHSDDYTAEETPSYDTDGQQHDTNYKDVVEDESHDVHHEEHKVEDHHPKLIVFDCKKCCGFCKKPKTVRRRRRKTRLGLFDFLKSVVTGEPPDEEEDPGGDGDSTSFGDVSISLAGGSQSAYNEISGSAGSLTIASPSSPSNSSSCCFNSSILSPVVIAVTIALIIVQGFSAVNIMIIVITPLIIFSVIVIIIYLVLQAFVPVYFIPIFIIVLGIVLIPIALLVILFTIMLPLFLTPVVLPFVLRLPGAAPGSVSRIANINCVRLPNSTISCSMTTTPVPQLFFNDTTDAIDYINATAFETTTGVTLMDFDTIDDVTELPLVNEEKLLKIPDSLYWKINAVLGQDHCLERVGCHLATYTNSYVYYNNFILRILENFSLSMNQSKFTAYKDAYQIGSLNITNHEKCATLYYCKKLEDFYYKKINL